jgi:tetratricopeptide (TPR) repeat protein
VRGAMSERVEILSDEEEEEEEQVVAPVVEPIEPTSAAPTAPAALEPLVSTCEDVAGAMARAGAEKTLGNEAFGRGDYAAALRHYEAAVELSEGCDGEAGRAVFFANRAAVLMAEHRAAEAVQDCDRALRIDPRYAKCFARRAAAREQLDKLEEALADHRAAAALGARTSEKEVARLEPIVKERQAKQTQEMLDQLKASGCVVCCWPVFTDAHVARRDSAIRFWASLVCRWTTFR